MHHPTDRIPHTTAFVTSALAGMRSGTEKEIFKVTTLNIFYLNRYIAHDTMLSSTYYMPAAKLPVAVGKPLSV